MSIDDDTTRIHRSGEYSVSGEWMGRMEKKQDRQSEDIRNILIALEKGDGRFNALEKDVKEIQEVKSRIQWGFLSAIGVAALSLLGWLANLWKHTPIILLGITLMGCGGVRHTQAQAAADAKAGAEAIQQYISRGEQIPLDVIAGLAANVKALTDNIVRLPKPTIAVTDIPKRAAQYKANGFELAANPPAAEGLNSESTLSVVGSDPVSVSLTWAGKWLTATGLWGLGIAALLFGLSFIGLGPWITPWAAYIEKGACIAAGLLTFGLICRWLGAHTWVLYVACASAAVAYFITHKKVWLPFARKAWAGVCRLTKSLGAK